MALAICSALHEQQWSTRRLLRRDLQPRRSWLTTGKGVRRTRCQFTYRRFLCLLRVEPSASGRMGAAGGTRLRAHLGSPGIQGARGMFQIGFTAR
jgi:hypothetical protein